MDTERSRRHASKLLTYPLTIGSVLHQNSGLTLNNHRVTPEGSRSLAGKSTRSQIGRYLNSSIPASATHDVARRPRCSRHRGSGRFQAPNQDIYSGCTCGVFATPPCLGTTLHVVPVLSLSSVLHWAAGISPKTTKRPGISSADVSSISRGRLSCRKTYL